MNEQASYGLNQENQRHHENRSRYLGLATGESKNVRAFSDSVGGENSLGRHSIRGHGYDKHTPLGKILERLGQIELAYSEYLGVEKICLEARLEQNRLAREKLSLQVAALKQEIYNLAVKEQESLNGSGHIN